MPSTENILRDDCSIETIVFNLSTNDEKLIDVWKIFSPILKIEEDIKEFISKICSQIKNDEFIKIVIIQVLRRKEWGFCTCIIEKFAKSRVIA